MNKIDELLARLGRVAESNDAANEKALEAMSAVMSAMEALIGKDNLPEEDSFLARMSTDEVRQLFAVNGELERAANYVRILGGNARHGKRIKRTQANVAIDHAREFVWAAKARMDPSSARGTFKRGISEAETRRQYVDVLLEEANWEVMTDRGGIHAGKASIEIEVEGMEPAGQNGYCDYVLFGRDGKPLAVVEVKRTMENVDKGRQQVKLYGECLERRYGVKPVLYYTNGYEIWCMDRLYPDRPVHAYHSLEELELLIKRQQRGKIEDMKPNPNIAGRHYQISAIERLCERFNKVDRHGLLVMATGTGKTRVAISLVDVLTRHDWAKNILFLADRTELVKQAYLNFAKLLPSMTYNVLSQPSLANDPSARITLSTYQTLIHSIDSDEKEFTSGKFDLIIVDEAHRSIFNKYAVIFDYFDSLLVGLTATPREQVDASTYETFHCAQGKPDYDYAINDGIREGFLVPWDLKNRTTDVLSNGITYESLTPEEREQYESAFNEVNRDVPNSVNAESIFKVVYNATTCDRVLDELMTNGVKVDGRDTIGKTVIFAVNHQHALMIVKRFNELYPNLGEEYCQLIDNKVKFADTLIDDFKKKSSFRIAVSVDMLDTGVDVPEIVNLVYFKRVRSRIKFYQMLGRGTRTRKDLFGPNEDKKFFRVFDYCGNFDYFMLGGQGVEESDAGLSVSQQVFVARIRLMHHLQPVEQQSISSRAAYWKELFGVVYGQAKVARKNFRRISVRKVLPLVDRYQDEMRWKKLDTKALREIELKLAPIIEPEESCPEAIRLFDLRMLRIELSLLVNGQGNAVREDVNVIRKVAHELLMLGTIGEVLAHRAELEKLSQSEFWARVSLEEVESMRKTIRHLMVFIEGTRQGIVALKVHDQIVSLPNPTGNVDFRTYRERVIDYLNEHSTSAAVGKLFRLEKLDSTDIAELERVLWQELGSETDYERMKAEAGHEGSIVSFLRSLIDIDDEAIMAKFGEFLLDTSFNAAQQEFFQSIVNYLRENGEVTAKDLVNSSPFDEMPYEDVFADRMADLQHLISIINETFPVAA